MDSGSGELLKTGQEFFGGTMGIEILNIGVAMPLVWGCILSVILCEEDKMFTLIRISPFPSFMFLHLPLCGTPARAGVLFGGALIRCGAFMHIYHRAYSIAVLHIFLLV